MCGFSNTMDADVFHTPVSYLSSAAQTILNRLDAKRIFFNKGPRIELPRDWRGLATLIGLTTQESEQLCAMKVLEMWVRRDENSTVHHLLRHLETMGRYDLIDDLKQLAAQNRLVNTEKWVTEEPTRPQGTSANIGFTPLTVADLGAGGPVLYDAAVLHADAEPEIEFANTLIEKMTKIGFKLFRKDDLQSNVMPLGAMTELINTRCRHIIVIFSPAFSQSPDDQFLSQYVHANQIAQKSHQMILCEFETCERSLELKFYRPMRVKNNPDFWWRLAYNLNASREDQLPMPSWIQSIMHSSANLIPSDPTSTRTLPGTANVPVADEANAPGYNHQIEGGHCSQHTDPDVANDNSTRTCSVTWAADIPEVTPNGFDSNAQHLNGSFANHSVAEYVSNEYVLNESDGSESVADNFVANDSIANGNDQVANETVAYYNVTDGPHQPTNYIVNIQVISENIGVHPNGHSSQPFNIKYPKERSDTRVVILRSILENVAQWCHKQSRVVRNRLEGIYKPIKTDTYIYQKNPAH